MYSSKYDIVLKDLVLVSGCSNRLIVVSFPVDTHFFVTFTCISDGETSFFILMIFVMIDLPVRDT
jgi:hypothetical protein